MAGGTEKKINLKIKLCSLNAAGRIAGLSALIVNS